MKTSVVGLFDDMDNARRVLDQLVGSPLDLSTVQVVHSDAKVQRELAESAGLPVKQHVVTGLVGGAVLGAAMGALAALTLDLFAALGPLLTSAAGILIGGAIGGLLGAFSERLRLPEGLDDLVMSAIEEGATAVIVRTDNLPTARAIRDLFEAGGSRVMPMPDYSDSMGRTPPAAGSPIGAAGYGTSAGGKVNLVPPAHSGDAPDSDHARFVPPWRRRKQPPESGIDLTSDQRSSESAGSGDTLSEDAG